MPPDVASPPSMTDEQDSAARSEDWPSEPPHRRSHRFSTRQSRRRRQVLGPWAEPNTPPARVPVQPGLYGPERPMPTLLREEIVPNELAILRRRRKQLRFLVGFAVVVAVSAIIATGVLISRPQPVASPLTPRQVVSGAVSSALSHKTADLVMMSTVQQSTGSVKVLASGVADLATGTLSLNQIIRDSQGIVTQKVIFVGPTAYFDTPAVATAFPGKLWGSTKVESLAATGLDGTDGLSDPTALLHVLALQGNLVRHLGQTNLGGTKVRAYSVEMTATSFRQIAKLGGPRWLPEAAAQLGAAERSFTVYVDAKGRLAQVAAIFPSSAKDHDRVTSSISLSQWGVRVSIDPPPAQQVVSLKSVEIASTI